MQQKTYLADKAINLAPPITKLLILARVIPQPLDGIEHAVHGHAVSEALEKNAELVPSTLNLRIIEQCGTSLLAFGVADIACLGEVILDSREEPSDGTLVVGVGLALDDNLQNFVR